MQKWNWIGKAPRGARARTTNAASRRSCDRSSGFSWGSKTQGVPRAVSRKTPALHRRNAGVAPARAFAAASGDGTR